MKMNKTLSALVLSAAAVLPACKSEPVTRTVYGVCADGSTPVIYNDNRQFITVDAPRARIVNVPGNIPPPAPVQPVQPKFSVYPIP